MAEVAAGKEIVRNVFVFTGKGGSQVIKGTRPAIIKKLKSLGINNPQLRGVQRQVMANKNVRAVSVSQITAKLMNKLTAGKGMGLGKGASGPNNPGMKPDELAKSKLDNKKKASTTTTNQKKTSTKTQPKTQPKTQSSSNMKTKINNLANKVKAKMPNVKMSTILDTIRSQIQKRPLTAVAGATGFGIGLATIIEALKPSKLPTDKEMEAMFGKQNQKQNNSKKIGKGTKKTIPALPISRPKNIGKNTSKNGKKTTPVKKPEKLYNLIAGGKGTAKQRLAEEDAAKRFKKIRGRNPSNKELVTFINKGNKMFSGAMKMFKKKK
jgi:hypothetical protein